MTWQLLRPAGDPSGPAGLADLSARPSAVLELLLLQANRPVSTDELIDQLWPDDPPRTARNSVQRFVADVRNALGAERDAIETTANGYRLVVDEDRVDLYRVRALRAEAEGLRRSDPERAAQLSAEALDHFGDLEATPAATRAAEAARVSFQELRLELLDLWFEGRLATGSSPELIGELRALTEQHPYHEGFWGHLMQALSADGRRVEALRAFSQLRQRLADDIGISPSAELAELELRILTESDGTEGPGPAGAGPEPAVVGPGPAASGLAVPPPPPADLVGREEEFDRVDRLLADHRVVTVTGLGGVGKTRLVTEAARRAAASDPAPMVVRLAEVDDDRRVVDVVAVSLGLQTDAVDPDGAREEIIEHLRHHPRLVVLDNAEHVLDATRELVDGIVEHTACPVLVSSRQRLGAAGEWVVALGPLSLPGADADGHSEAERLFRLRASAVDAHLDDDDQPVVAQICLALDGLPLALELAAAQLANVGARDLLDRLDARRLQLAGANGQSGRHSTLAAMMDWSWSRLTPDETTLLEHLAVFRAPIELTVVEQVTEAQGLGDDAFTLVSSLVARSLVTSTVIDGRARFSLLETVRLYARARAEEDGRLDACRDAHAAYLLGYLRQWSVPDLNAWLDTIAEIERHQLEYEPALEWLDQQGRVDELIELVTRLTGLWARRGPGSQLSRWAERLLQLADEVDLDHEARVAVTVTAAEERFRYSDHGNVAKYAERLVALEEIEPTDLGTPFVAFWGTALHTVDLDPASRQRVEDAHRRAARTPTSHLNRAQTEMWLGCCQLMGRQFEAAIDSFSSVLHQTDRPGGVLLWSELGRVTALHLLGRVDEARAAMASATSTSEVSIWHYAVDIVEAVLLAADGEVDRARADLISAARTRIREQRAATRDEFQIGFGLLAASAGDHALADELLGTPMPQSPVSATLLFNRLIPEACSPEQWRSGWATQMVTRLLALTDRLGRGLDPVEIELARWAPGSSQIET